MNPHATAALRPPRGGFAVTPSPDPLPRRIRWVNLSTDGTVTATLASGETVTLFLVSGVIHGLEATHITAAPAGTVAGY